MCVRLCDGYYFPISYKAGRHDFKQDALRCAARCPQAPVRLFVHPSGQADPEKMRDLQGNRYADLKNAFLYRKHFIANCRCHFEPWTSEARNRHHEYMMEEGEKEEKRPEMKLSGLEPDQLPASDLDTDTP